MDAAADVIVKDKKRQPNIPFFAGNSGYEPVKVNSGIRAGAPSERLGKIR